MNVFDLKHMSNPMDMLGSYNSIEIQFTTIKININIYNNIYHINNINIQQYIKVTVNTYYYIYQYVTKVEDKSKFRASNVH